jgi:glucose/arabinose dehydrogenase
MRRLATLATALAVTAGCLVGLVIAATPAAATVPAGFADELVTAVASPTALAFTPDGRMLVTTQGGTVRVVQNGSLLATPALDLSSTICTNSERGVLGVAVDPAFATNGYVFLYYSFDKAGDCGTGTVNRVARFVMTAGSLASETVLVDNIPSPAGNHNGGDLQFGPDNLLYVSVGDGGCDYPGGTPSGCGGANDASRDRNVLVGKILRITRDGAVAPGNPYSGAGTARCNAGAAPVGQICQETFAWGLRNPFRMAVDPNSPTPRLHINDVGQSTWEEIDLGTAGADYGWNVREGHCANGSTTDCGPPPAGMTNPIFDYGRADGCRSITGGAFVPDGVWPAPYQGRYLFADFGCGKIFRLDPAGGGGFTRTDFATNLGGNSAVHLRFGPHAGTQALFYTTYAGGGQVRRIVDTASPGQLRVTTSPALPSQIVVDGVPRDSFGLNWLKLAPGQHSVGFTHVEGWTEPEPQTVTVSPGAVTTVAGTFTRRGFLRVRTEPAVPGAVSVDGVPRDNWGMFTDLPTGNHQVCFAPVAGFTPPACQTATLTAGAETLVTGAYAANAGAPGPTNVGELRVTTSPAVPSQILVDGVPRDTWGLTWLQLAPGSHTVSFTHVQGWTEPAPQTVTVTAGAVTTVAGTFTPRGVLRVVTSPAVPGTISVDGVPRDDWGMWTDLPTGPHQVCFGPVPGKTEPACQGANLPGGALTTVTGTYA